MSRATANCCSKRSAHRTGFGSTRASGTTFCLDLLALLMAPLAFTWFEQPGEEGTRAGLNSLEVLESLRRHADRLTLFCHAGRIAPLKTTYPQLAFVENSIVECHPVRAARSIQGVGAAMRQRRRRRSVSSVVPVEKPDIRPFVGHDPRARRQPEAEPDGRRRRNRGLVDFVRALPRVALRQPVDAGVIQRVETLAAELEHTEFELPDGIKDLRFWPLGIGGRARDPLAEAGSGSSSYRRFSRLAGSRSWPKDART